MPDIGKEKHVHADPGSRTGGRHAWVEAHTAVEGVPRWARFAAYAIPFTVLPSSVWRIAVCTFHAPVVKVGVDVRNGPSGVPGVPIELYVIVLSVASELLAFAAVGLIAGWGETFPRWVPGLRGRTVPPAVAIVPAGLAAAALTLLCTSVAVSYSFGRRMDGGPAPQWLLDVSDWRGVLAVAAYAPLLLWGPLLAAVTVAYVRRRREPHD